jgi:hypothetical protein
MYRSIVAWLWSFSLFRYFVILWVSRSMPGADWVAVNTPLLVSLRELFRETGDHDLALRCTYAIWENEGL